MVSHLGVILMFAGLNYLFNYLDYAPRRKVDDKRINQPQEVEKDEETTMMRTLTRRTSEQRRAVDLKLSGTCEHVSHIIHSTTFAEDSRDGW